jgi:hypothetical protein
MTAGGETEWSVSAGTSPGESAWVIQPMEYNGNLGYFGTVWMGNFNSNWEDPVNWDACVPTATSDAAIGITNPACFPAVNMMSEVRNVFIGKEGRLTGFQHLVVHGQVKAEKFYTSWSNQSDGWYLISAPVNGSVIPGSCFVSGDYDLYSFEESQNTWLNQKVSSNVTVFSAFQSGKGYLFATSPSANKIFKGTFYTTDVIQDNLSSHPGNGDGWHLLGNPFPADIKWATGWNMSNICGTAQVLKTDGTGYHVLTEGDLIPPCEGFWVQVFQTPGSITIPLSACTPETQEAKTNYASNRIILRLFVDSVRFTETSIRIHPQATDFFDPMFDARYLSPLSENIPQMFTSCETGVSYALNSFPLIGQKTIPLKIFVQQQMSYSLDVMIPDDFDPGICIFFEDTLNGDFFDLRNGGAIQLNITPGDPSGRFLIHFGNILTGKSRIDKNRLTVTSSGDKIILRKTNDVTAPVRIKLYTITGQLVLCENVLMASCLILYPKVPPALYLMQAEMGHTSSCHKIMLIR